MFTRSATAIPTTIRRRSDDRPTAAGPMTLANMRAQGVRSLSVSCLLWHHGAMLVANRWPDEMPLPSFGPRMVCTGCGIVGADVRPN